MVLRYSDMMSMTFGHADQPTNESTVHEAEVLGELCQQLKSDDGWHGNISALSQVHESMEQHRVFSPGRELKVSRPWTNHRLLSLPST